MIYKKHGIRGIYHGLSPCLIREIFGYGLYFGLYDWILKGLSSKYGSSMGQTPQIIIGGSLSGLAFWAVVFPFDTIKTLFQQDNLNKPVYTGII